jgi:hypothetical protein
MHMGTSYRRVFAAAVTALGMAIGSAHAAIIFSDNFDTEPPPGSVLNYAGFANWTVTNGTVDLIQSGNFGITCVGGSGKCVDMDGSSANAGRLDSTQLFNLAPGDYVLHFSASGNQRGGAPDSMSYGFGSFSDTIVDLAAAAPFATYTLPFTLAAPASGRIFFDHAGGDNLGIILDNVVLESRTPTQLVAEPPIVLTLGLALLLAGYIGRRRSS